MRGELIDMGDAKRKRDAAAVAIAARFRQGITLDRVEYLYVLSQSPVTIDTADGAEAIEAMLVLLHLAGDGLCSKLAIDGGRCEFTITEPGRAALLAAGGDDYVPTGNVVESLTAVQRGRNPSEPCATCGHFTIVQGIGTVCALHKTGTHAARGTEDLCGYWGRHWVSRAAAASTTASTVTATEEITSSDVASVASLGLADSKAEGE